MTEPHYEPLSALDAAMVYVETEHVPMHVGVVGIFDARLLTRADGGLDRARILAHVAGLLADLPRHGQRLAFVPIGGHPVWIDAEHVDLSHHVQFLAVPRPGTEVELKELVGRAISTRLDRERPLWELIFVEGLEGGRFAMIAKLHHCMVDGVAAARVFATFFSPDPAAADRVPARPPPRPSPSRLALVRSEVMRRARIAWDVARHVRAAIAAPAARRPDVRREAHGILEALKTKLRPTARGRLNPALVGKDRAFEWVRIDLDDVKRVKNRLGGKVNDVVLSIVAGVIRRYLARHGSVHGLPDFHVVVPFDTRALGEVEGASGNRVVPTLARLPIELDTASARYEAILQATRAIKASGQVKGLMRLEDLANLAVVAPIAAVLRATTRFWAGNLIVTNVPGPPVPCYFLGARMLACYPIVPLLSNQALGIALLSYAGGLHFGFHADREALPDLAVLPRLVTEELAALLQAE